MQACAGAEAAYTRALSAASKVPLVGNCDGASLRAALDGFSDLPFMVGQVCDPLEQRRHMVLYNRCSTLVSVVDRLLYYCHGMVFSIFGIHSNREWSTGFDEVFSSKMLKSYSQQLLPQIVCLK